MKSVFSKLLKNDKFYNKMVLISFVKLYEIHIFPKVEGSSSKMNGFLSLYSSDFRGAWQAQFLSHSLEILN